jgi:hypothetical protein
MAWTRAMASRRLEHTNDRYQHLSLAWSGLVYYMAINAS